MRKYTYILQTHNPDKKYIVDNIVENISCGYSRRYCEKKYVVNNVVVGPVWLVRDAIQGRKWMIIVTRSID